MRQLSCVVLVGLLGCSSAEDGPPPPGSCNKSDRNGTYRQTYEKQDGNCGDLPAQIVSFDALPSSGSTTPGLRCTLASEHWSENDCKLARIVQCSDAGGASTTTVVTRQQTQNGSTITGSFSVSVRLRDGTTCLGTYGVTAIRQ